jgi:hypothetical protein
MTEEKKVSDSDLVVQEHCIDLPGETVQCWIGAGTDKLKVILRKHRDVIFDIHLGNKKTYTVESTESDFYNPIKKKLVHASQRDKVTFEDGERLHVWISRDFRGALILKLDERIIYKVEPDKLDRQAYSKNPKEKPAPIIIAIGNDRTPGTPLQKTANQSIANTKLKSAPPGFIASARPRATHAADLSHPTICIVDGKAEGMPPDILELLKKGGDNSGFSDIDPNHIATRNWILGQIVGVEAYIEDNWRWLRASLDGKTNEGFKLVKAQIHYVRGKVRFYFSGYSNTNPVFGRGGFGPSHERIMTIFAGAGKTTSTFGATLKGIAGTFENAALVSFVFGTATAIAEWTDDVRKDGYDLAAALVTSTLKTILTAAVTTLVTAFIVWLVMIVFGAAVPVIAVGAITIGVSFLASYLTETADKLAGRAITHDESSTDGVTSIVAQQMRKHGNQALERIIHNWKYLMHKMSNDYQEIVF